MYTADCLKSVPLMLLLAAVSTPLLAKTENLAIFSLEYTHEPAGSDDGKVMVLLNQDGYWSQIQNQTIKWRMRVNASWNMSYAPEWAWHQIEFRPEGYPYIHYTMCNDKPACYETVWQQAPQEAPIYKTVQVPYTEVFAHDGIGADPVSQCHGLRDEMLKQGKQLRDILGHDQIIDKQAMSWFWIIKDPHTKALKEIQVPLTIVCKGDKQIAEAVDPYPDMAVAFQVTGASLNITPGHKLEQECPAELNFTGKIQTSGMGPATVEYRFEWPNGQKSNLFTATVSDAAKGADISHKVAIPLTPAFVPGSEGGGGLSPGAGGFAQVQQPPPPPGPLPEAVPEQPQGPVVKGETLPANEHKNDVRLVVTSHGGAVSNPAGYHIVCKPRPAEGISGPAGVTLPMPDAEPATDPRRPVTRGSPDMAPQTTTTPTRRGDITLKRGVTEDDQMDQQEEASPDRQLRMQQR